MAICTENLPKGCANANDKDGYWNCATTPDSQLDTLVVENFDTGETTLVSHGNTRLYECAGDPWGYYFCIATKSLPGDRADVNSTNDSTAWCQQDEVPVQPEDPYVPPDPVIDPVWQPTGPYYGCPKGGALDTRGLDPEYTGKANYDLAATRGQYMTVYQGPDFWGIPSATEDGYPVYKYHCNARIVEGKTTDFVCMGTKNNNIMNFGHYGKAMITPEIDLYDETAGCQDWENDLPHDPGYPEPDPWPVDNSCCEKETKQCSIQ